MARKGFVGARMALVLACVGLSVGAACGGEEGAISSGIAIGGRTTPFDVEAVTGPEKGQSLCYV